MFEKKSILQNIVNNSVNGVIIADAKGVIKAYSKWCTTTLGWEPEVNIGKNLSVLAPTSFCTPNPPDNPILPDYLISCKDSPTEFFLRDRQGDPLPVQFAVREMEDEEGNLFVCYLVDMSQHYVIEEKKKALEEEISILTSNIPGIVFQCGYSRNRPVQFIDKAIEDLSGITRDEFVSGKAQYSQLMHPDDELKIWHAIGLSLKKKAPYTVEYRLLHKSGKTTWVSENGRVALDENGIPQSIVGVITDNTLTKTSNAEFESTVNALNKATASIEFDLTGCVITANEHFLSLLGYDSLDEIQGHHHRLFCTPEFYMSPEYEEFWESLRGGQFASGEYLRIGKNGKQCWIQASYNPILDADGKPYKIRKFATDLGDRKAMERDLRIAVDKAEEAVTMRGSFMANMSHEIRTPMNSIIGFTELLLKSSLNDEQLHQLKIVHNASRSLLRLLNEILDMAKLEKGAVDIEITNFNFMELCEQIIGSLNVNAEKKGIKLLLELDKNVPTYMKADSLRIQQILLNILSNAVKFTEKGSVTLNVQYKEGILYTQIVDTGIGIDKAYLDRIFDPFTQAEASTTRRFGGSGLGTAIALQLVELMKGSIRVESELNVGTTFFIELPVLIGEEQNGKNFIDYELPSMHILAVDDTPNNLELVKITMRKAGHTIEVATDGQEAVNACKKQRYDVILMDMQMPKMDGMEATKQIRAYEKENNLSPMPIIAFSASVLERDRQDAFAAGMQGFAAKPLDPTELFREIKRVLTELEEEKKREAAGEKRESLLNGPPKTKEQSKKEEKKPAEKEREILNPGGINWKAGLQIWGDKKTLTGSIKAFLEDNTQTIFMLQEFLDSQNFERFSAQVHKISGAAANLSLYRVHKLAKDGEVAARKKEAETLKTILPALDKALKAVAHEIENGQKTKTEKKSSSPLPDQKQREQIKKELEEVEAALKKNEMPKEKMKILEELLPKDRLASLQKAIHDFDFKQALQKTSELKNSLS